MNSVDRAIKALAKTEKTSLPDGFESRLDSVLSALPENGGVRIRRRRAGRFAVCAAAAVIAVFVALPNLSPALARTMGALPVLGPVARVVTFRHYEYEDDRSAADVLVPFIAADGSAAGEINRSVDEYTRMLLEKFLAEAAEREQGYGGLDVFYQVVTDTPDWLTLRLIVVETMASGYEYSIYYNADKRADRVVSLGGLFAPGSGWDQALKAEILRQMAEQEAQAGYELYFPEELRSISPEQNYYFNENGGLVIAFNEYDVAPGAMGCPEFTIPKQVYGPYLQ